jgi:Ca-activated chloride channel family protein
MAVVLTDMHTTYTDVRERVRLDSLVEFITRRSLGCGDRRVERLVVADTTGRQFEVLTTPDSDPLVGLRSGDRYHISSLLCADPDGTAGTVDRECPDCGGPLRPGRVLDTVDPAVADAVAQLGLDEPFGILDSEAAIQGVRAESTPVDDWIPAGDDVVGLPDCVCRDCGRRVERRPEDGTPSGGTTGPGPEPRTPEAGSPVRGGSAGTAIVRGAVANGYTPHPAAVDVRTLLSEHCSGAGARVESPGLFALRCGAATGEHPVTGETERYLSVGLESTVRSGSRERPGLDLVVVLDVSRSMGRAAGRDSRDGAGVAGGTTKLEGAVRGLSALTAQLRDGDRLGVVLCNSRARVAKPLRRAGDTELSALHRHVRGIEARGGTNIADGLGRAFDLLGQTARRCNRERRAVVLTDAMANTGRTDPAALTDTVADAATRGFHTTVVGVGLDVNATLARRLRAVRGGQFLLVPPAAVERQIGERFDSLVAPVVYDLTLELDADGYELETVHGAESTSHGLVYAGCMFPTVSEGVSRCGPVVLRLRGQGTDPELSVSWTERDGGEQAESVTVGVPDGAGTRTDGEVRTAAVLCQYARALRRWARNRHREVGTVSTDDGHDRHSRRPVPLGRSEQQAERFARLRAHLAATRPDGDTLEHEIGLLDALCRVGRPPELRN